MSATVAYYGGTTSPGLVLYMDAGKPDCYPGYGTTWRSVARGNNVSGSLINGVVFTTNSGSAMIFDGVDDYVSVVPPTTSQTEITITIWYYKTTIKQSFVLNARNSAGGREYSFNLPWNDSSVYWDCGNNGGNDNNTVPNYDRISKLASSTEYLGWNHWAFWKNTSIGMKIYRNGIEWQSGAGSRLIGPVINLDIARGIAEGVNVYYDNGTVSNLQIYNRALSAAEILQNYNTQKGRFGLS